MSGFLRPSLGHSGVGFYCPFFSPGLDVGFLQAHCVHTEFIIVMLGFPGGLVVESTCQAGDARDSGLIPGSGRSPGVGNGNPL